MMRVEGVGRGLGLAGAVAFIGGGLWVALVGAGGDGGSSSTADETSPTASSTQAVIYASPAAIVAGGTASLIPDAPTATATTASAASPTTAAASAPTSQAPPTATRAAPVPPVTPRSLPKSSAFAVIDLSRLVRLPSGRTFADCVTGGPDREPWPSAVHDYWVVGTADWVIETHLGDVGLIYDEDHGSFRVRNIEKAGC